MANLAHRQLIVIAMSLDDFFASLILHAFKLCIFVYFLGPREELLDRLKGYMMQVNNPFKVPFVTSSTCVKLFIKYCVKHL